MKNFNIFTTPAPFKPTNIQPTEPKQLQPGMWYEGEIACLLGDQQSGKSLLAIQIAERVAREHRKDTVLYFDFKMTAAEFTRRYSRDGKPYVFPENLLRCGLDYSADSGNDVDNIIGGIEQQCKALNSKIIIIDSLTWINTIALKSGAALRFMTRLYLLARKLGLSVLVVAETSKDHSRTPITVKSLRGYRRLAPFFDSIFAVGKSIKGDKQRYIKQIYAKDRELAFGDDHTICATIETPENSFLRLHVTGYAPESTHLPEKKAPRRSAEALCKRG